MMLHSLSPLSSSPRFRWPGGVRRMAVYRRIASALVPRRSLAPAAARMPPSAPRRTAMIDRHLSTGSTPTRRDAGPSTPSPSPPPPLQSAEPLVKFNAPDTHLRTITLNRPKALNALNIEMVQLLKPKLQEWEENDNVKLIIMKGTGRAFCAGGDVVSIVNNVSSTDSEKRKAASAFFKGEYEMDAYLAKMTTPIVCLLNGITMGGGVGLSVHTPFRIATETTRVAMPETTIGLFPDVGACFFLSRMDGELGLYLGLTSENIYGWGALQSGFATHFVPASCLDDIESRLSALSSDVTFSNINAVLDEYAYDPQTGAQSSKPYELIGAKRKAIDRCFSHSSISKILKDLKDVELGHLFGGHDLEFWARETRETIEKRSPTSCAVTIMAVREAKKLNIDETFLMDMRLAATCCDREVHPDFVTGVTHLLINKQKTRADWKPATFDDVKKVSDTFFSSTPPNTTYLPPLDLPKTSQPPYTRYPHSFGLPTELEIKDVVRGEDRESGSYAVTREEVIKSMERRRRGKPGVREKVNECLDRKADVNPSDRTLKWRH